MAFIPQNDSGDVADANAYIDVAYFRAYHADRGNDVTDPVTSIDYADEKIQGAIVVATDYIDSNPCFNGEALTDDQATAFPRDADEGIPRKIKNATAEYALAQLKGGLELSSGFEELNSYVTSERSKVGPIEEEKTYGRPANLVTVRSVPVAERLLAAYLCNNSYFGSFSVNRG